MNRDAIFFKSILYFRLYSMFVFHIIICLSFILYIYIYIIQSRLYVLCIILHILLCDTISCYCILFLYLRTILYNIV